MGFRITEKRLLKILAVQDEMVIERPLTLEEFDKLAVDFPDFRMEREGNGLTTIKMPLKRAVGIVHGKLIGIIGNWCEENLNGEAHGNSIGIQLPDTAIKSPSFCWVSEERLAALPPVDEGDYWLCAVPDFVVEVRSKQDCLDILKMKMRATWQANGVRLGWLIDPAKEQVWVYRLGEAEPELVEGFSGKKLSGEDVLPGFELPLEKLRLKKR